MIDILTCNEDKTVRNRFSLIYHRFIFNIIAIFLMLVGLFFLSGFVYDCYKNSGLTQIVVGRVVGVTELPLPSDENKEYVLDVSYFLSHDGTPTNAMSDNKALTHIHTKEKINSGELVDLEIINDPFGNGNQIKIWNIFSTIRYNGLPFIGFAFVLLSLFLMYKMLFELKAYISLFDKKPFTGHYKGNGLLSKTKLPTITFINDAHCTISLCDNSANKIYKTLELNQEVEILYDKGYFVIRPVVYKEEPEDQKDTKEA
ncbi:MAG: hypothetical protein UHG91_07225 [Succinivibrionaceae bacterium]|nr:hypothetical protein [Ruminobacter sp.]MDY5778346.1 hypothetical protein [Succinivibrionaceae bacterium]MEE1340552.1 hypothetical protein [Succinivibrionaceae bacterium]